MPEPEPKTARGRKTRLRILTATADLIAEHGVAEVHLDDVCDRARVSRSQLYHYFEHKADLVRSVVSVTTDAVVAGQADRLDTLDSWAAVEAWCEAAVAHQQAVGGVGGCPIGSLVGQLAERDECVRVTLATSFDRWEGHLAQGLEHMMSLGLLGPDANPARLATAVMASLQGGLLLSQTRRDAGQLRIALDGALAMLRAAASPMTLSAVVPARSEALP